MEFKFLVIQIFGNYNIIYYNIVKSIINLHLFYNSVKKKKNIYFLKIHIIIIFHNTILLCHYYRFLIIFFF